VVNEELSDHFINGHYNIENPQNIKDYLEGLGIRDEEVFKECSEIYRSTKLENIELYTGVVDVLDRVREKGLKIALVTDAEKFNAMDRLEKVGLLDYFETVVTFDDTGKKKPDLEPFLYCLDEMGLEPKEVVLVGDSLDRDVVPGKEIGMLTVHAKYGDKNYMEKREVEADQSIEDVGELMDVFRRFNWRLLIVIDIVKFLSNLKINGLMPNGYKNTILLALQYLTFEGVHFVKGYLLIINSSSPNNPSKYTLFIRA